jgi:hypothetical protein
MSSIALKRTSAFAQTLRRDKSGFPRTIRQDKTGFPRTLRRDKSVGSKP